LWIDGMPQPEHGPGMIQRVCRDCGASWVGLAGDPCGWCAQAWERQVADQRRLLLDPPWLQTSQGDPRYDELSDDDQAVWDRTRGQSRGADSLQTWIDQLKRAVETGLVTRREADRAVERVDRRRHGTAQRA
jgi:hypothetical protein